MKDSTNFGYCDELGCHGSLEPVWFIDEEYEFGHGSMWKTSRKRKAISHLVCNRCLKNFAIDDSFDGPWQ